MDKYFKHDDRKGVVLFIGDTLEIYIPQRYERYGCLHVEEFVMTMGIFDMVINGSEETGMFLPSMIRIEPTTIEQTNIGPAAMYKLTLHKGDVFMRTETVKNGTLAYVIFDNFISLAKQPKFFDYRLMMFMFDVVIRTTGVSFNVDHAVFEMIFAYLCRDPDDPSKQYRHGSMRKDPLFVSLKHAATLTESTTSKLLGPYFDDALDSALINQADQTNEVEELLRK
jgi:hypothetical protein